MDAESVATHSNSQPSSPPHPGSITAVLLNESNQLEHTSINNKTVGLNTHVRDLSERLSSYESCISDSGEDSDNFSSPTSKGRGFKRNSSRMTPLKRDDLKKVNLGLGSF